MKLRNPCFCPTERLWNRAADSGCITGTILSDETVLSLFKFVTLLNL